MSSQGTCLGHGFSPQSGCVQEATNSLSPQHFSPPLSLISRLSRINKRKKASKNKQIELILRKEQSIVMEGLSVTRNDLVLMLKNIPNLSN